MKDFICICLCLLGFYGLKEKAAAEDQSNSSYKYDLSICVIFQNEAPYLKEWIEYHKLLGVKHFYCFNHCSTDHYLEVLAPYIQEGTVELKHLLKKTSHFKDFHLLQCKCYTDCLGSVKGLSKWVAFIDVDEFLLPIRDVLLINFLEGYENYGGIAVNWLTFGTSNLKKIPEGRLLIESLLLCSEKSSGINRHVKSIVRPERVSHFENPHQPIYLDGYFGVNTDKFSFEGNKSYSILMNKLRINHYWTRDEEFFYKVKIPRQVKWGGKPDPQLIFQKMNAKKDETILRYLPELKKKMNNIDFAQSKTQNSG
jgi:hypothetical protein